MWILKFHPKGLRVHSKALCFRTFRYFKSMFASSKPRSLFAKPLAFQNLALSGFTVLSGLVMLLSAEDSAIVIVITSQTHWEKLNSFSPKVASVCTLPSELSIFWNTVKPKEQSWGVIKLIPLSQGKIQILPDLARNPLVLEQTANRTWRQTNLFQQDVGSYNPVHMLYVLLGFLKWCSIEESDFHKLHS